MPLVLCLLAHSLARSLLTGLHAPPPDGNLDGLADLLGLRWEAPPYLDVAELIPTPPGSGLLFESVAESDGASASLSVKYVYPVPTSATGEWTASAVLDASGELQFSTILANTTAEELDRRLAAGLQRYPNARDCYAQAAGRPPPAQTRIRMA